MTVGRVKRFAFGGAVKPKGKGMLRRRTAAAPPPLVTGPMSAPPAEPVVPQMYGNSMKKKMR